MNLLRSRLVASLLLAAALAAVLAAVAGLVDLGPRVGQK